MPASPDSRDDLTLGMYRIDGETDLPVDADPEEAAYADLEEASYASFGEAMEAIQGDSLDPSVLTGFTDITRKNVHELRRAWNGIADADARRTIAEHVAALGMADVRLDFMRFFRVLLDDPSASVRQVAAASLEPYDDPALIDPLVAMAQGDENEDARQAAIEALASFTTMADFEMLEPKDQQRLRKALMALVNDASISPRLRAAALVSASADSGTPKIRETIAAAFDSGDPDLRLGAVKAMGRASAPEWVGVLEGMLRSTDVDERQAAVQSLSQYGDESVVPMLTQVAREDPELPVRLEAIAGLGEIGSRAALQNLNTLREYVSDDEIEAVDVAIAEVEEFLAIDEGMDDDLFVYDPMLDDEDDV